MQCTTPFSHPRQSVSGASATLLQVAFAPHTISSLSRTKIMEESTKYEPNLRRLVACTNTLDAMTAWIHQDLRQRVQERVGVDLGSGIDVEVSDTDVEI
jgi:hypothetical protein